MRVFSITFFIVLIFSVPISAQSILSRTAFDNGTQAARAADFETAIREFHRVLLFSEAEKTGDDFLARVHFNVGVCLFNLKRTDEAAAEFVEAIKLSRRNYRQAFYALGMTQFELKNWQKAEQAFRDSIALKKDDGEAWFDLGLVLIETQNYEAAETAFQRAIKYKSIATADAHNNLGVIFALRTDFPAAEREFKTALNKSNGDSVEARNNLRLCDFYKQNFNQNLLAKLEFSRKNKQGE